MLPRRFATVNHSDCYKGCQTVLFHTVMMYCTAILHDACYRPKKLCERPRKLWTFLRVFDEKISFAGALMVLRLQSEGTYDLVWPNSSLEINREGALLLDPRDRGLGLLASQTNCTDILFYVREWQKGVCFLKGMTK